MTDLGLATVETALRAFSGGYAHIHAKPHLSRDAVIFVFIVDNTLRNQYHLELIYETT